MGRIHLLVFLTICLLFVTANSDTDEVEDEHEFTYESDPEKGPDNWGTLKPEWNACKNGKLQSPIDLNDDRVAILSTLGQLRRTYKTAPALLKNRGHDIMVEWQEDAGGVMINGTEYRLRQCHWHTPSEHTVDGKSLKMEIHLVHDNSHGQIAVIGILYKLGRPDPFIQKLLQNLRSSDGEGTSLGEINPWDIKFGSRKYFRYIGSLTVPPCTEGVVWSILKKVRTASREQIRALRESVDDGFESNARPLQDLGDNINWLIHFSFLTNCPCLTRKTVTEGTKVFMRFSQSKTVNSRHAALNPSLDCLGQNLQSQVSFYTT